MCSFVWLQIHAAGILQPDLDLVVLRLHLNWEPSLISPNNWKQPARKGREVLALERGGAHGHGSC
jgi:hypothetical protein